MVDEDHVLLAITFAVGAFLAMDGCLRNLRPSAYVERPDMKRYRSFDEDLQYLEQLFDRR